MKSLQSVFDFCCSLVSDKKEFILEVCHKVGTFLTCNRLIMGLMRMSRCMWSDCSLTALCREVT